MCLRVEFEELVSTTQLPLYDIAYVGVEEYMCTILNNLQRESNFCYRQYNFYTSTLCTSFPTDISYSVQYLSLTDKIITHIQSRELYDPVVLITHVVAVYTSLCPACSSQKPHMAPVIFISTSNVRHSCCNLVGLT